MSTPSTEVIFIGLSYALLVHKYANEESKVTQKFPFSNNVSGFGPKIVVIFFLGVTQRQEIQIKIRKARVNYFLCKVPRQKKKKVTEKNVVVKNNMSILGFNKKGK